MCIVPAAAAQALSKMLNRERQDRILELLAADGRVVAADLAKEFGVSEDAVRRDLRELAGKGLCRRVYGGALSPAPDLGDIQKRVAEVPSSKRALGQCVTKHLEEAKTIFIDASSTNLSVAEALPRSRPLTVVTNAPAVAVALSEHPQCQVIVLGGSFNAAKGACLGSQTTQALKNIYIDTLILGACGVDAQLGLTAFDAEEAEFKRCLIEQSARVIVPVITNKLGTAAPHRLSGLSAVDLLVLESSAPAAIVSQFTDLGVKVEIAQ